MENYLQHIPYFLVAVIIGIVPSLLRLRRTLKVKGKVIENVRYVEESFAALWISIVVAGLLDYYTDLSLFAICAISMIAAFFHSQLIDIIGNDLILFMVKKIKDRISKLFS